MFTIYAVCRNVFGEMIPEILAPYFAVSDQPEQLKIFYGTRS